MKTINLTKCLCVLLFTLVTSQTVKAEIEMDWVYLNGLCYEIAYDREHPDNSAATIIGRDWREPYWDSETGTYVYPESAIRYEEWDTDSILILPAYVNGVPLRRIMEGFAGCSDIKDVIIPGTVTTIGNHAFAQSSLETIAFWDDDDFLPYEILPISFEGGFYDDYFGGGTFEECERLTSVDFHRPVKQIVPLMFKDCSKLESVGFYSDWLDTDDLMPFDTIGYCAFLNCYKLSRFDIPQSVKVIDEGAFAHCHNLRYINLPSEITSIGDFAFAECHLLNNVVLSPSIQTIGKAAFLNCRSLTSVNIPKAITTINDYTFYDCRNLTHLNLNNVTTLGERSFAGCNMLTSIDLTKVDSIGKAAFFGGHVSCYVGNRSLPLSISYREESWNENNGSLKNITLGEHFSTINELTFIGHIPETITCLAPTPPVHLRTDNFCLPFSNEAYDSTVLRVPQVLVNDYREAFGWSRFKNIEGMVIMGNGDVNGDGQTSISDVTALIDVLLSNGNSGSFNPVNADVNGDGRHSISDVSSLIDMLLNANN